MVHGATVTVWSPDGTLLLTSHYRTGRGKDSFLWTALEKPCLISFLKLSLSFQPKSDLKSRWNCEIGQYQPKEASSREAE